MLEVKPTDTVADVIAMLGSQISLQLYKRASLLPEEETLEKCKVGPYDQLNARMVHQKPNAQIWNGESQLAGAKRKRRMEFRDVVTSLKGQKKLFSSGDGRNPQHMVASQSSSGDTSPQFTSKSLSLSGRSRLLRQKTKGDSHAEELADNKKEHSASKVSDDKINLRSTSEAPKLEDDSEEAGVAMVNYQCLMDYSRNSLIHESPFKANKSESLDNLGRVFQGLCFNDDDDELLASLMGAIRF